jgi:hypothetical protein
MVLSVSGMWMRGKVGRVPESVVYGLLVFTGSAIHKSTTLILLHNEVNIPATNLIKIYLVLLFFFSVSFMAFYTRNSFTPAYAAAPAGGGGGVVSPGMTIPGILSLAGEEEKKKE